MNAIRVLHFRNCRGITEVTGPENYLLSLAEHLPPEQCKLLIVCTVDPQHGQTPWLQEAKQRQVPLITIPVKHRWNGRDLLRLVQIIQQFQPHIVHTHDHRADVVGVAAAKLTNTAAVATFAGWTNWNADSARGRLYAWLDQQALKYADVILSDSAAMAAAVDSGPDGPPVLVIPNGVDLRRFDPATVTPELRARFGADHHHLLLGMVGRIHPNKGQMEFLKAAARLRRVYSHCRFVIVGEAPPGYEAYKEQVLRFIAQEGLESIVYVTKAAREEIPSIMASLDILVAPSRIESFSFSLIEAMAMEVAVISTTAGGTPELINDGADGLLIPPDDPKALVDALSTLIADPSRRRQLGQRARQKVQTQLSTELMAAKILRVYQEILQWRQPHLQKKLARSDLRAKLHRAIASCVPGN